MKRNEMIEMIENFRIDEIQNIFDERENDEKNYDYKMNNSQFIRFKELIEKNYDKSLKIRENEKNENLFKLESIEDSKEYLIIYREYQNKEIRMKDIKIISESSINFSLKLIYHIDKENKKEYRLFLSYKENKNKSSKIRRLRLRNEEIKKSERNEEKMRKIFKDIMKLERDEIENRYIK